MTSISVPNTLGIECNYDYPNIPRKPFSIPNSSQPKAARPKFIDANGKVYDVNYRIIDESQLTKNKSLPPFPNPKFFKSKFEFAFACEKWKETVKKSFNGKDLPQPLLSYLYCPPKATIVTKNNLAAIDKTLIPINYLKLYETLSFNSPINPETEFPKPCVDSKKRDVPIKYENQIALEPQWQSQFIPCEPKPQDYSSYNEFKAAYERWASIVIPNKNKIPIPPSTIFQTLANVNTVVHQKRNNSYDPAKVSFDRSKYSWAESLKTKFEKKRKGSLFTEKGKKALKDTIIPNYQNAILSKQGKSEPIEYPSVYVLGCDMTTFIKDFEDKGVFEESITSNTPIHANVYLPVSPNADDRLADLFSSFLTPSDEKGAKLKYKRILEIDFDHDSLKHAMNKFQKKMNSGKIDFYSIIHPKEINKRRQTAISIHKSHKSKSMNSEVTEEHQQIFDDIVAEPSTMTRRKSLHETNNLIINETVDCLTCICQNMRINSIRRMGFIIPLFINDKFIDDLLHKTVKPEIKDFNVCPKDKVDNLWSLFYFTKQLYILDQRPMRTIFEPETKNLISYLISQLYYLDLLLQWPKATLGMKRSLMNSSKSIETIILKMLKSKDRADLDNDNKNIYCKYIWSIENNNVFEMIIELNSSQVLFVLLDSAGFAEGTSGMLNQFSTFQKGRSLLLRLAFNSNQNAMNLFMLTKGLYLNKQTTLYTAQVFSIILDNFYYNMYALKGSYNISTFINYFYSCTFIDPLISYSRILGSPFLQVSKQIGFVSQTLITLLGDNNFIENYSFDKIEQTLLAFFDNEECVKQLATKAKDKPKSWDPLLKLLADSLSDTVEKKIMLLAWKLMNKIGQYTSLLFWLELEQIVKALTVTLPKSRNPVIVHEYISFLNNLIDRNDELILSKLNELLLTAKGDLSEILNRAPNMFEYFSNLQKTINEFKRKIMNTGENQPLSGFKAALKAILSLN